MSDTITEYMLNQECEALAKSIVEEYEGDRDDIDALREYAQERAHEDADGHQWVIYTYKARQVASIAPDAAEEYLEEINGSKPFAECSTYAEVVTHLAYAAMYTGIMSALDAIFEELEAA